MFQEVHGQERPGQPRGRLALAGTSLAGATLVSTKPEDDVFDVRNLVVASHLRVSAHQQGCGTSRDWWEHRPWPRTRRSPPSTFWYIVGFTRGWPLLAPTVCSSSGAPEN